MRLVFAFLLCIPLFGVTRTWTGTGADCPATCDVAAADNWSPSGSPGVGDDLVFDNTCTNCNATIVTSLTISSWTMSAGYTGVVTENASQLLTATGAFSIAGGTLTATGTGLTVGQGFSITGGTLTMTGATLTFNGGVDGSVTCSGDLNSITGASSIVVGKNAVQTIVSGCTLTASTSGTTTQLTVQSSATFAVSGATATFNSLNISGTFTATGVTLTVGIDFVIGGSATVDLSGGTTLTMSGGVNSAMTCTGDFNSLTSVTSITLSKSAVVTISNGCTVSASTSGSTTQLTTQSTGVFITVGSSATFAILTNAGTFTAASGTTTITFHWTNTGTFNHNSGTVVFGSVFAHDISGSTTFNNLTLSGNNAVTFQAGTTQTVQGTFSANGIGSGTELPLHSSSSPSVWSINAESSCSLSFLSVKDSTNTGTYTINAGANSINEGNNTKWAFSGTGACILAGGSYSTIL